MRFTIGKKLGIGFGIVVLLMGVTFLFGVLATSNVREAQGEARASSASATFMLEKVVDHYEWLDAVNAAFVENHDSIDVELDPKLCGLGTFLYGEQAKDLAATSPEIARLLEEVKQPHAELHDTAHRMNERWRSRHIGLEEKLWEVREDHGTWAREVAQAIARDANDLDVQMDATRCGYGEFLESEQYRRWAASFPPLKDAVADTMQPHKQLHESARDIQAALRAGQRDEARRVFEEV
ncbi:MAG: CZB domain-containing protein, partial [Phycisphaeraceae bacterium]